MLSLYRLLIHVTYFIKPFQAQILSFIAKIIDQNLKMSLVLVVLQQKLQ